MVHPPQTSASITGIRGEATGSYFSAVNGDKALGTKECPYGIENAKQLYYFSWLQDMGFFNEDKKGKTNDDGTETSDGVIEACYFVLMNDIDAGEYILPPCGISKYPFVGNFDGNNCVIKNLRVANSISEGQITNYPKTLDSDNERLTKDEFNSSPAIVGFFGIIGKYVADISYDTSVNAVKDLYFDKLTIQTSATSVMAGLLAGYANGSLDNCGVRSGKFEFSDGVSPIANSTFGESNSKLSKYSLIGDYNPTGFKWNGKPGGGQQTDFGGSIDMLSLARRVSYIKKTGKTTYNVTFGSGSSTEYSWLAHSTYTKLTEGSYLPINVDMEKTKLSDVSGKDDTTNSYYTNNASEPILETNSGYLTGGDAIIRVQACNKGLNGIQYAVKRVSGTTTATSSTDFDLFSDDSGKVINMDKLKSNIGFLTYSFSGGNVAAIYDDDDKGFVQSDNFVYKVKGSDVKGSDKNYVSASSFAKYSSVKSNILQMFYDSTNAYYNNGGDKTYAVYLAGFRFNQWTTDSTFNVATEWLGEEKSIALHNNGVQFEIKKDGYITAVVSKYASGQSFAFYNLYSVDMDNGAVLTKINTIHKDSSGNITYNSDDTSTKIFDFAPLITTSTGMYAYQLFYFEIPIKKGAYFLSTYGSSVSSGNFPYLLYLDIGANSGDSGQSGSTSKSEIDFTYYKDPTASTKTIAKISDEDFVSSYCTFYISGNPGTVYFWRIKDGESLILYYYFSAGTVKGEGTGTYQLGSEEDYTSN